MSMIGLSCCNLFCKSLEMRRLCGSRLGINRNTEKVERILKLHNGVSNINVIREVDGRLTQKLPSAANNINGIRGSK